MAIVTCPELHAYAETIGVHLTKHTGGVKGYYLDSSRTISTRRGLSIQAYKSTLAHELGHATHRDRPTGNGHFDQRQEVRADQFAANLLIDSHSFWDAVRWHQGHLPAVADELEVTRHILRVYLAQNSTPLERIHT
ncbi:ImmA/IrrE family metallo-endopeptidase [Corynebacterium cystitidis]|uniref:ImmA/IrrE family metallo-endopeptidase n=1 Tax=Corynebacterium cystitidis TaxID=35757 RepID=UPI00211EBCF1|nr:ImmA/IrrE family metallo-endopeptidase [Corynebacterium cystitidis]